LYHVDPSWDIVQEAVFGPVAVGMPFHNAAQAIRVANQTRYGLAAAAWTRNALPLSSELEPSGSTIISQGLRHAARELSAERIRKKPVAVCFGE
jgi:hypothetical protein